MRRIGRAEKTWVLCNVISPIKTYQGKCDLGELRYCVAYTCRNHEVCWRILLQHIPHGYNVVRACPQSRLAVRVFLQLDSIGLPERI